VTGALRPVVPVELLGVSDTHGTPEDPDDDPDEEAGWPANSEEKSATPGAAAAGPFQYR